MDLGSRTKMINFEPLDATPAPAEQFDRPVETVDEPAHAVAQRAAITNVGPVTEPIERQLELIGTDWV